MILLYLPVIVVVLLSMFWGGFLMIIFHLSSLCYSSGVFIHFGDRGL